MAGVFTYNVVDFHQHLSRVSTIASDANEQNGPLADGIPLRVMFLGASITRGEVSDGDRGYRKHIRDKLTSWGNPVNFVGFTRFGDWEDNDVEGYGAHRIRKIHLHAQQAVPALRPNLVLVQVGTSDCFQKDDIGYIITRMRDLANVIIDSAPEATVILSTLATTPHPQVEPCMLSANAQIRQVANDLIREKKKVALAEMHYDQGLPDRPKPEDIGPDRIHPTNEGYIMMGDVFLEKIREVAEKGLLERPVDNGIPDNGDDGREVEVKLKEKAEAEHPIKDG